jgi:glutamate 5-kinase
MRSEWTDARRIVVKIGSSLLVDAAAGVLRRDWLSALCDDIADLRAQGKEVIVVSSGAIALGRNVLKLPKVLRHLARQRQSGKSVRVVGLGKLEVGLTHFVPCGTRRHAQDFVWVVGIDHTAPIE